MIIEKLELHDFKCFSDIEFEFGNLNLLAGSNGCGKSTVIQALLLIRQSYEQYGNLDMLSTYGKYVNLGMAKEILCESSKDLKMKFRIESSNGTITELEPEYDAENHILKNDVAVSENYKEINLFEEAFEYLSAERIVPQTVYSSISPNSSLGMSGENAFDFLEKYGDKYIVEPVFREKGQSYLLFHVNEWLNRMFNGFRLQLSQIAEADAVSLRYQEVSSRVSNSHRATNVGFGITYVLPILVALLKIRPGDLVIIENPEAHLHPKAQRLLGELVVKAASTGAQIIIETHSDHILNGIRISVKKFMLEAQKVKLFFFMRENVGDKYHVNVYAPELNQEGDINIWPEGFFDEWDNALAELF